MTKRTETGENLAIDLYCKLYGAMIVDRPNPPDAHIRCLSTGNTSWIEVTSVWLKKGEQEQVSIAAALNSDRTRLESFDHNSSRAIDNHKMQMAILSAVYQKDSKASYEPITKELGRGVLIAILEDLWLHPLDLQAIASMGDKDLRPLINFQSVLLYLHSSHTMEEGRIRSYQPQLICSNISF